MTEKRTGPVIDPEHGRAMQISRRDVIRVGGYSGLALAMGGTLSSILSACAPSRSETAIEFFTLAGARFGEVESALAERYMEDNPDVTVHIDEIGISEFFSRVATVMTEEGTYEIVTAQLALKRTAHELGLLQELTPLMSADFISDYEADVADSRVQAGLIDGKYYGVGHDAISALMYYREDLFDEAGVGVPTTWEDAIEAAARLDSEDHHGMTLPLARGKSLGQWFEALVRANGSTLFDDSSRPTIATPEGQQALELTKELMRNADPDSINAGEAETAESMQAGIAAFCPYQLANPLLTAPGAHAYADVVVPTVIPSVQGRDPAPMSGGLLMWMPSSAQNPEQTWEFMKFLVSKEAQLEGLRHTGVPSRLSILRDPSANELNPVFATIAESLEFSYLELDMPEGSAIYNTIGTELHVALTEQKSIENALADAEAAVDEIMQDAGYY